MNGFQTQQDTLLQQLAGMGIDIPNLSSLSGLTGSGIASSLANTYGIPQEHLPPGLFQPISENLLNLTKWGTYSPAIRADQTAFTDKMLQSYETGASSAYGGFAGSGAQVDFSQGLKDVYGREIMPSLTQATQQRAGGFEKIQEILNQWKQQAGAIRGHGTV